MKAIYTDQTGSIETDICNDFQENSPNSGCLTMLLDGVSFSGNSFDDFELQSKENYTPRQLQRFTFNQALTQANEQLFFLCNCNLQFEIPVILIDSNTKETIQTLLFVNLQLGKPTTNGGLDFEEAGFQITINNQTYKSTGGVMEDGLVLLKRQMAGLYQFKNCFGCLYADYSPYGVGFFQTLMCFKKQKNTYLDLNKNFSKQAYFGVMEQGFIVVQETYSCSEFEIRSPNTGYRG